MILVQDCSTCRHRPLCRHYGFTGPCGYWEMNIIESKFTFDAATLEYVNAIELAHERAGESEPRFL